MTIDDNDAPRRREPDRAELGEMVWKGHGGRRPRVLAHGGSSDKHLVVGENHLWWDDDTDGTITRLPKDGGVPLELATDQLRPTALARHGGFLYWAVAGRHPEPGRIVRMPEDGGDVETVVTGARLPQCIVVSGRDVYWTEMGDGIVGTVKRGSIDGGPPVVIASKQKQPSVILCDGQQLFWVNRGNKRPRYFIDGSVMRAPVGGGKKRWIVAKNQSLPSSIALDETSIYWSTATMYEPPYAPGAIFRRSRAGGKAVELASLNLRGSVLLVDATHVYCMASYEGPMFRIPKGGGELEQLLSSTDPTFGPSYLGSFAMDERFLYWTANFSGQAGGAIWKLAK